MHKYINTKSFYKMHRHINTNTDNRNFCVLTIEQLNKSLETHDQMVGRSCFSIVAPGFSSVLVVMSAGVICGNILNIFWGGIQTTKTSI